jgi:hypothetical protein
VGTRIVRYIADSRPDYRFSLSNDVTFKKLRLYFLVDRQKGGIVADLTGILWDLSGNSPDQTVPKKPGALTGDQRATRYAKTALTSYSDATYWKLREVTLSLDVPTSWIHSFWGGARYVRLAVSGRNLLTVTNYTGSDPEVSQIVESAAFGIPWELWAYPPSRSVWFSVDLGF